MIRINVNVPIVTASCVPTTKTTDILCVFAPLSARNYRQRHEQKSGSVGEVGRGGTPDATTSLTLTIQCCDRSFTRSLRLAAAAAAAALSLLSSALLPTALGHDSLPFSLYSALFFPRVLSPPPPRSLRYISVFSYIRTFFASGRSRSSSACPSSTPLGSRQ